LLHLLLFRLIPALNFRCWRFFCWLVLSDQGIQSVLKSIWFSKRKVSLLGNFWIRYFSPKRPKRLVGEESDKKVEEW